MREAKQAEVSKIVAYLDQTDETGRPVFSDDELRAYVPFVVFTLGDQIAADDLNDNVKALVGELGEKLGITAETSREEQAAKIEQHFEENPVNPELDRGLWALLRELLVDRQGEGAKAATSVIGGETTKRAPMAGEVKPGGALQGRLAAMLHKGIQKGDADEGE